MACISLRLDKYASSRPFVLSQSELPSVRSPAPGKDTDDLWNQIMTQIFRRDANAPLALLLFS